MNQETKYNIIITTTATIEDAEKIANQLLEKKLAACIQTYPIKSYYAWKGKVNADNEQILLIKAKSANYEAIEATIQKNHSYEIPEIVQIPITAGLSSYFGWIDEVTE